MDGIDRDTLYSLPELETLGFHPKAVQRMVSAGTLESPARGVYLHSGHEPHMLDELAVVAKRCPEAVFNLYTAARYHDVTQAVPGEIWIGLPPSHPNAPSMGGSFHLDLRVLRWSRDLDVEADVEKVSLRGVDMRITGMARTVVDMWRYSDHNPGLRTGHARIHDENLLQCMGAYLEKTGGSSRGLAEAARRLDLGPSATEAFFRFCRHYSGGFSFSQTV